MPNESKIIFKPSKLRTLLGLMYIFILVNVIGFLIFIITKNFVYDPIDWSLLGSKITEYVTGSVIGLLILFLPLYSYNSITIFEEEIEGPTLYGLFWRKIKVPVKNVILKDFGNDYVYSRISFGHVLSSMNGDKINILWLEKNKFDELLALIESKSR